MWAKHCRGCAWRLHASDHVSARALGSLRKHRGSTCTVVCADGPINANMARLWEACKRTKARYWVFLDDDIEFLGGDVLGDCVKAMVRHRWAGCSHLLHLRRWSTKRGRDYETWRRELLRAGSSSKSVTRAG